MRIRKIQHMNEQTDFSVESSATLRRLRLALGFFILALILSGITAFPLKCEVEMLVKVRGLEHSPPSDVHVGFDFWILKIRDGLRETYASHPWIAYATDWLAFAHIAIAVFFIGALKDPVRNIWILQAGLIACVLVVPLALICGVLRQIPLGWRLIDCSFGVIGAIPLYYCLKLARNLERNSA